jgi:hypothetical protein
MQPQTAAAGAPAYSPAANGMIIYSGATLGRPHMNNNFKRIDAEPPAGELIDLHLLIVAVALAFAIKFLTHNLHSILSDNLCEN